MPRRFQNTFQAQTPIGQAISNLGMALFSGPTQQELADEQAKRELVQARIEAARAQTAQRQADAAAETALQAGRGKISDIFGGLPGQIEEFSNFVGPRPADQPQTTDQFTSQALLDAQRQATVQGVRSGIEGDEIGDMIGQLLNAFGGDPAEFARLQAAGGNFIGENEAVSTQDRENVAQRNIQGGIAEAVAKVLAEPLTESQVNAQILNTLSDEDRRINVLGAQAFGSPLEKVASPDSPSGVVLTPRAEAAGQPGVPTAATSRRDILPNAARTDAIDQINNARNVTSTTARLREVITPSNFGAVGAFKGTMQNLAQQVDAFGDFLGLGNEIKQDIAATGSQIDPALFDPSLPAQDFLINTLAYQVAKMNDPSGRLSDADVRNARASLAARGILANMASFVAVLDEIDAGAGIRAQAAQSLIEGNTVAPVAPNAGPGGNVIRYVRDANGVLRRAE